MSIAQPAQTFFMPAVNSGKPGHAAAVTAVSESWIQPTDGGMVRGSRRLGLGEARIMDMNHIGKFEMREILNEFDATLIRLFGVNMLDAAISRYEALEVYSKVRCPRKAAELSGLRLGLKAEVA
jgi:hypothetical protein